MGFFSNIRNLFRDTPTTDSPGEGGDSPEKAHGQAERQQAPPPPAEEPAQTGAPAPMEAPVADSLPPDKTPVEAHLPISAATATPTETPDAARPAPVTGISAPAEQPIPSAVLTPPVDVTPAPSAPQTKASTMAKILPAPVPFSGEEAPGDDDEDVVSLDMVIATPVQKKTAAPQGQVSPTASSTLAGETRPAAAPQHPAPAPVSEASKEVPRHASPTMQMPQEKPKPAPQAQYIAAQPQSDRAPAQETSPEEAELALALREAEPRLSAWLAIALSDVERADDLLWERVRFLLRSLEAPDEEIEKFIDTFRQWLEDMEYEDIEEFRSELQYRLALALDLEDEEDERSRLMLKLSQGLAKTREQIAHNLNTLFSAGRVIDEDLWEELEEILLMADVGYETAHSLTEGLRRRAKAEGLTDASSLHDAMRREMLEVFKPVRRLSVVNPPEVILAIGVNGVGKTTTIAKLCHRSVLQGKKVLLAAGDTFRAAATEQLEIWAKRAGAGFYAKGHGADPAAVAYEAIDKAVTEDYDTIFVDTAGRLHTKVNLMEELTKVSKVLGKRHPGAPHRTILVIDATTGQNAISQVKLFNQACAIDELILTKLDGTAKGGIAVAVAMQFGIPISFVGLGEKMEDLRPFDAESYVTALLGLDNNG